MKLFYKEYTTNNLLNMKKELTEQLLKDVDDFIEEVYDDEGNLIGGRLRFYKIKENPVE